MSHERENLSKLLSSAVFVFVGSVLGATSKLLERVVVGRLLSPELYGDFSLALAVFTLAGTLGAAGFTQGVPRFMARFEEPRDVRGTWLTGLVISLVLSVVLVAGLLVAAPAVVGTFFETEQALFTFYAFALAIPLYACFRIGIGAIRGQENTRYKVLAQDIAYPVLRIGIIVALLVTGGGLLATGLGYLVALVVVTGLTYVFLDRLFPLRGEFRLYGRKMTAFSVPLIVSTIMTVLLTRTDTLMLGYFRSSAAVGVYNAAYPLAGMLTVILTAFGYLYLPIASRLDDEDGSVERVYEVTTKWVFLVVFPAFLVLLIYPDTIISAIFGGQYDGGGLALSILAVGFFTNAAVGRNRETLSALGATQFILTSNVCAFALNVVLNLVLIPRFGYTGAAATSAISYLALNAVVYTILRAKFEITPFNAASTRCFVTVPLVLVPLGCLLRQLLPETFLVACSVGVGIAVLTVAVVAAVGGLEAEDRVLLDFIEEKTGRTVPLLRGYMPEFQSSTHD